MKQKLIVTFLSKEPSSWEGVLDFETEKCVVSSPLSGQGLASSLNYLVIDILEFLSTGNELKLLTLGAGAIYILVHYDYWLDWCKKKMAQGTGLS